MDWPELVEALKPLGFRPGNVGHWMRHIDPADRRRIESIFDGRAEVLPSWNPCRPPLFTGPYAEVVEYLQKVEKEKKP